MPLAVIVAILIVAVVAMVIAGKLRAARRADYIRGFSLPIGLYDKLRKRRPDLTVKDCQLVGNALRQFFMAYLKSGRRFVAMPSQVADELWHEFILYTRNYDQFCQKAFGRFLHHTPAAGLGDANQANSGLRRCWWYTCREENINPAKPLRLPLLFAIDTKLKIADGFHYLANCDGVRRQATEGGAAIYCGSDFSSTSIDGSTDGFGDSTASSSSTGGADGGGDSGSGSSCGGGGCGGD
jgi:hypothetical protein